MDDLPRIGCEISDPKPPVFELVLSDYIEFVDPKDFDIEADAIKPSEYFVTSGDAVEKARALKKDYIKLALKIRRLLYNEIAKENGINYREAVYYYNTKRRGDSGLMKYESALWKAFGKAVKLFNALDKARGDDCFLETEWDEDHRLKCIPKNPRK